MKEHHTEAPKEAWHAAALVFRLGHALLSAVKDHDMSTTGMLHKVCNSLSSFSALPLKVLMQPLHALTDAWCDECRLPHCWRQPGTPHGTQR